MAKQVMDVEALLHEAYARYRVERVDVAKVLGLVVPTQRLRCAGAAFMELGTRVDTSGHAATLMGGFAEAGSVPIDMADLHDRVLALPDVYLERRAGEGLRMWTRADAQARGGDIMRGDGGAWMLLLEGERRRVDQVVTSVLVSGHARLGTRPDWCEEGARAVPFDRDKRGRAAVWDLDGRRDAICPIRFDPHPDTVIRMRGEYAVWHGALAGLAQGCVASPLAKFDVTGPSASRAPWSESAAVVHRDLRGSPCGAQRNA